MPLLRPVQHRAGRQEAALHHPAERDARLGAFRLRDLDGVVRRRDDGGDALAGEAGIAGIALQPDEMAAESSGDRTGRAGTEEGIEHDVARPGRGDHHAVEQGFGLLRRMRLLPVGAFQALMAGADRQRPVGAHLQLVVQRLHRFVVEGVLLLGRLGRPDQRLMRIGEAAAAEIRHRVCLAPHHVVQDPEAQILQDRADAEDVVVGADHPQGAGVLQHAARLGQPVAGEAVVVGEAAELVPGIVDGVDLGLVRTAKLVLELEVIGRIGEDQVGTAVR